MQNNGLSFKECFTFLFQKDCAIKLLKLLGISLLPILGMVVGCILCATSKGHILTAIVGGILVFVSFILILLTYFYVIGYFLLYAHDRAYNRKALYRDVTFSSVKDIFVQGAKYLIMSFIQIPFGIAFLIITIPSYIIFYNVTKISTGIPLNILNQVFSLFLNFVYLLITAVTLTKVYSYFIKDMKIGSLFEWGEAFAYTKDLKGAFMTAFIPFVISTVGSTCVGFVAGFLFGFAFGNILPQQVYALIGTIIALPFAIIGAIIYCNLLGQYTYIAIAKNNNCEPETLESVEDKEQGIVVVLVLVALLLMLFILGVVAALTIPTLINRQAQVATKTKLKKSVASYEKVITVYMLENNTKNISDLSKDNCADISNYFRIIRQNGCSFETADGVQWRVYKNGSATATANDKSITMGVCKDGTINCPQEYPEIEILLNNNIK